MKPEPRCTETAPGSKEPTVAGPFALLVRMDWERQTQELLAVPWYD
jgi:hypothetical protein